jgi:hypothetical protein
MSLADPALDLCASILSSSGHQPFFFGLPNPATSAATSTSSAAPTPLPSSSPPTFRLEPPPGVLSALVPHDALLQLAASCAERCIADGRTSIALQLLLVDPPPQQEEKAFHLASEFLTPCLLQPRGPQQRNLVLNVLRDYLSRPYSPTAAALPSFPESPAAASASASSPEHMQYLHISMVAAVKIAEAADHEQQSNWAQTITSIDEAGVVPRTTAEIFKTLELYNLYLIGCIARNMPDIILLYVSALAQLYANLKLLPTSPDPLFDRTAPAVPVDPASLPASSSSSSPTPGVTDVVKAAKLTELRQRAEVAVTFAGQLPPEEIARVHIELIRKMSTMN